MAEVRPPGWRNRDAGQPVADPDQVHSGGNGDVLETGLREADVPSPVQADRKDLAEADRVFVDTLLADIPALSDVHDLAHRFAALVRKQGTGTLDD
ncbi:hypothetical protein [Azospirillum aestuarii]|uniref:hypothetical protein n=1 Tax=Azospirillum aestuarii TaxID=2802052 RepID=UPI00405530EB